MTISADEVRAMARLARLAIDDDQLPETTRQLSRILEFVAQMDAVDTAGVAPLSHPQELDARLRADTVTETDQRDHFQRCAPDVGDGLYLVPQVIE